MQSPGPLWRPPPRRMLQPLHNLGWPGRACACQRARVTDTGIPPATASAFNLKLNAAVAQEGSRLTRRYRLP